MLLRPRRGEPRRARRSTASPVSASRVHGLLLPFLPETACRTSAQFDDGFMPPNSPKSLAASRGVQWFRTRRAAAGFVSLSSTGENESLRVRRYRTGHRGSSASAQPEPCRPREPGRPSRPGVLTTRHSAATRLPEIGERLGTLPSLPWRRLRTPWRSRPLPDDGRKSSHRLGGCRGELREGQTVTATLAWGCGFKSTFCRTAGSILFCPLAKPGTALCHEIVRPRSASARQSLKINGDFPVWQVQSYTRSHSAGGEDVELQTRADRCRVVPCGAAAAVPGSRTQGRSSCHKRRSVALGTGAPWRDLPERYGPYATCCNRCNRWSKAGALCYLYKLPINFEVQHRRSAISVVRAVCLAGESRCRGGGDVRRREGVWSLDGQRSTAHGRDGQHSLLLQRTHGQDARKLTQLAE